MTSVNLPAHVVRVPVPRVGYLIGCIMSTCLVFAVAEAQDARAEYVNSVGMKLVLIQPGVFNMGSDDGPDDERPAHQVAITRPFYSGARRVMGLLPQVLPIRLPGRLPAGKQKPAPRAARVSPRHVIRPVLSSPRRSAEPTPGDLVAEHAPAPSSPPATARVTKNSTAVELFVTF